jgi:hypothetical protein
MHIPRATGKAPACVASIAATNSTIEQIFAAWNDSTLQQTPGQF